MGGIKVILMRNITVTSVASAGAHRALGKSPGPLPEKVNRTASGEALLGCSNSPVVLSIGSVAGEKLHQANQKCRFYQH